MRKSIKLGLGTLALVTATNTSSFLSVGMEHEIYSPRQAALVNSTQAVPLLYDIGFHLGHKKFYGDNDFLQTAAEAMGTGNFLERPYLFRE